MGDEPSFFTIHSLWKRTASTHPKKLEVSTHMTHEMAPTGSWKSAVMCISACSFTRAYLTNTHKNASTSSISAAFAALLFGINVGSISVEIASQVGAITATTLITRPIVVEATSKNRSLYRLITSHPTDTRWCNSV